MLANPRERRNNGHWKPWTTLLSLLALCFLLAAFLVSILSNNNSQESAPEFPTSPASELQAENESAPRRRRLQERKTLSPGARATVLMAHEMAVAHAKEQGHHIYEEKVDPFQAMRVMYLQNKALENRVATAAAEKSNAQKLLVSLRTKCSNEDNNNCQDPLQQQTSSDIANNWDGTEKPQVEYLGVMVDAGRHSFSLSWFKILIVLLQNLDYNLIHLRLTDDEQFNLKLHPQDQATQRYKASELKELVAFAKDHGITMVPEINFPLRAASWAAALNIPGLIVTCPNYICDTGHYVPLNLDHPEIRQVVHKVLEQVLDIFEAPPLLHLGGSQSLRDADGCLEEAGKEGGRAYWTQWQDILRSVLKDLDYPEDQVIRLQSIEESVAGVNGEEEEENLTLVDPVGGMTQFWMSLPSEKDIPTSIVSTGLDVTVDDDDSAMTFNSQTKDILRLKPKAIVVATWYLSEETWYERNVLARLVAISMAAKSTSTQKVDFELSDYVTSCQQVLGPKSMALCDFQGHTMTTTQYFVDKLGQASQDWRNNLCQQLTVGTNERVFQPQTPDRNFATSMGNTVFWKHFHRLPTFHVPAFKEAARRQLSEPVQNLQHRVAKTGVIFDLANSLVSAAEMEKLLLAYVAPLGFNMLQLRLSDDFAFAVRLENNTKLPQSPLESYRNEDGALSITSIPKTTDFQQLVDAASEWDMEVFPEVSITTNAGGWVNGGFLVACPERYCHSPTSIPNDIREPQFLAVVYSVLWELRKTFGGSSPYLHLGNDERVENLKCFEESGLSENEDPPFRTFEKKLMKLLLMLGIQPEHVIRYDNLEQLSYEDRAGSITHYRIPDEPGSMPDIRDGEPFWMTADLLTNNIFSIYKDARQMAEKEPMAVLGEIRTLDRKVWKEQHMGIRLIALILGLSEGKDGNNNRELTQRAFVQQVVEICRAVKFADYADDPDCQAAEKLLKSEKKEVKGDDDALDNQPSLFSVGTEKFKEVMCQKNTRARKTRLMREKYMLPKKDASKTS